MIYQAKDFIETKEGLLFAVVENELEQGRVLCFLRYAQCGQGWRKKATDEANRYLAERYPDYLYYSATKDAALHGVHESAIIRHYQPRQRLKALIEKPANHAVEADFQLLIKLLAASGVDIEMLGVTGSLLVGMHKASSDIDLIFYDRQAFHRARAVVKQLMAENRLTALTEADWIASYDRRSCHISLSDYQWHEERKINKGLVNGRKFDLSLNEGLSHSIVPFRKRGHIVLQARISDDAGAFDYPAIYQVDDGVVSSVICFTATYIGQALTGEKVEVAGLLEESACGQRRIVVGSSREAPGEYIRVIR